MRCVRDERSDLHIIDVDELDDAVVGPWEWDVHSTALHLALAAHNDEDARRNARDFLSAYRSEIRSVAAHTRVVGSDATLRAASAYAHMCRGSKGRIVRTALSLYDTVTALTACVDGTRSTLAGDRGEGNAVSDADVLRWFAEYRENLPEAAAFLLAGCTVVDADYVSEGFISATGLAASPGDLLVLARSADRSVVLRAHRARASAWPDAAIGSDAQRILLAASMVRVVADPLAGWSTDARNLGSLVWSTALARPRGALRKRERARAVLADQPRWWLRRHARALGSLTGRAHAASVNVYALAGYLGGSSGFDDALAESAVLARRTVLASS